MVQAIADRLHDRFDREEVEHVIVLFEGPREFDPGPVVMSVDPLTASGVEQQEVSCGKGKVLLFHFDTEIPHGARSLQQAVVMALQSGGTIAHAFCVGQGRAAQGQANEGSDYRGECAGNGRVGLPGRLG